MPYEYDIFVSYRREDPVREWVQNHFAQELTRWLKETTLAFEPKVFVDTSIGTGSVWPKALRDALLNSRLLVPVLSPSYWRSEWCVWEFESMRARQTALAASAGDDEPQLIFPARFSNGVPTDVGDIQYCDFANYNLPAPAFRQAPIYLDFLKLIQGFAEELVQAVAAAPPWEEGWPIETPPVNTEFDQKLVRL
jgi:hypothetical protein